MLDEGGNLLGHLAILKVGIAVKRMIVVFPQRIMQTFKQERSKGRRVVVQGDANETGASSGFFLYLGSHKGAQSSLTVLQKPLTNQLAHRTAHRYPAHRKEGCQLAFSKDLFPRLPEPFADSCKDLLIDCLRLGLLVHHWLSVRTFILYVCTSKGLKRHFFSWAMTSSSIFASFSE
ncbi:hypothetical protein SDC9_97775 [bioreactor metagenome]|uniref:Uncharacterized protein n=1 Tax=bioreactor metagenome TaxID=1076179 RepID=A0A645ACW8_9ZZZZ